MRYNEIPNYIINSVVQTEPKNGRTMQLQTTVSDPKDFGVWTDRMVDALKRADAIHDLKVSVEINVEGITIIKALYTD